MKKASFTRELILQVWGFREVNYDTTRKPSRVLARIYRNVKIRDVRKRSNIFYVFEFRERDCENFNPELRLSTIRENDLTILEQNGTRTQRNLGRDPFKQNFRKFRSKIEWIGSVHFLRYTNFLGWTGQIEMDHSI